MIIWKPVVGYDGLYEVSNTGLIRTVERIYFIGWNLNAITLKQKNLLFDTDKDGYYRVKLRRDKMRYNKVVSRIVCEAFHDNPENKPVVNHKDGIKKNNNESNLEWATYSENEFHSFRVLGKKSKGTTGMTGALIHNSKPLYQYDLAGNLIKEWESLMLAVKSGFSKKSIYQVLWGDFKQHKGFFWSRQKIAA